MMLGFNQHQSTYHVGIKTNALKFKFKFSEIKAEVLGVEVRMVLMHTTPDTVTLECIWL